MRRFLVAPLFAALMPLAMLTASPAWAAKERLPKLTPFNRELQQEQFERMAERADQALEAIFERATRELWRRGMPDEAERMSTEWKGWQGFLPALVEAAPYLGPEGIGDHAALSTWLTLQYDRLESILGAQTMRLLRLDDIQTVNFTFPLVFHLMRIAEPIDLTEYTLHWTPFCGVVSYWSAWTACEAGTWGTGGAWLCTPIGMAAEYMTVKVVAPPLAPKAYARFYPAP